MRCSNDAAAATALVAALPFMAVSALLVLLEDGRPVLFKQKRAGENGRLFEMLKFRTMHPCDERPSEWVADNAYRITRVGKWLRKLRIDELPQLWNVLRGDMAIVGPRPERPEFVKVLSEKIPYYRQRHCVKPGVTGWAQINHKYGDTIEDTITKLEYDLYYIKHRSLLFDVWILLKTAVIVLSLRGR